MRIIIRGEIGHKDEYSFAHEATTDEVYELLKQHQLVQKGNKNDENRGEDSMQDM